MKNLNPRILEKLSQELNVSAKHIRNQISLVGQKYPSATPNARAQIYAQENGKTVRRFFDQEDRQSFPSQSVSTPYISSAFNPKSLRIVQLGKKEDYIYNKWWFQLFIAGIFAGIIAQVAGAYFAKLLGITN